MSYGFTGKVLHIDLTKQEVYIEKPKENFYRKYAGGSSMGLYYVLKNSPKGSDPLSSKNVLSLFTGVLTGVPISGQSRLSSVARSPLTYAVGDAPSGGFFPAE